MSKVMQAADTSRLLMDPFGRRHTYLRVSVTDRCNLRCLYCSPSCLLPQGPREEILTYEEITRVVRVSASMGVTKVRLTGGEPLLRRDIERLVQSLVDLGALDTIALTTNGVLLAQHAAALKSAGLSQLNVSLDTLRPERFARIALRDGYGSVWQGIDAALEAGFVPLRVNVVVLQGINDDELLDFVEVARDRPFFVRFIECMPFTCSQHPDARLVPYAFMRRRIEEHHALTPVVSPSQVAREFRIQGFAGTIGFITPMSSRFCGECNRLRLLADGSVRSCLFAPATVSIRQALRAGASDAEVADLMIRAVRSKRPAPAVGSLHEALSDRDMVEIGG